jgi:diguanylate cyclase (GGDEF)-like protein/PAS domain S-box-containing protein
MTIQAASIESPETGLQPIRVVMVEDNPTDVELILRQIRRDGLDVVSQVAADEHSFRRALAEFAPNLILSDFSLPQFDGLSALRIAREAVPDIPFIFVSGTIGEERAINALKTGAFDYVLKDNLRRLVPAIRGALRAADTARARDLAMSMLRRSESRLQDIINSSADWVWECDETYRFTFSSPSIEEILGYGRHAVLQGLSFEYVSHVDKDRLREAFDSCAEGADVPPVVLRWMHKDGKTRWLERKMIALRGEDGTLRGYRGIDRDVTTRKLQEMRIVRLNRAIGFLSGINSAIVRIRDRRELLHEACRLAVQVGEYSMATIYLKHASDKEPIVHRAVSASLGESQRALREPLDGSGPVGRAMAGGTRVLVPDLSDSRNEVPDRQKLLEMGLRACIALPLNIDGTPVGVFLLHANEKNAFTDAELTLLDQVTGNVTFSLQYLHSRESIEYLEYFDTLTALANRTLYLQRLETTIRETERDGQALALLVFDIAGLTVINDGLGRHAGDLVLQLVAERLKDVFRDSSVLCHLGGGCFAVHSSFAAGSSDATTLLRERIELLLDDPFKVQDQEIRLSVRAGFAEFPEDGGNAEALLHHAQTALDHAKRSGEAFLRHRPDMNIAASERLSLTTRLRGTAAQQQFQLHYQPIVRLSDGSVEAVEALLRWPGSNVSPAVFVPLLESIGLIGDVGKWVLGKALAESDAWRRDEPAGKFRVAVNISALQLRRERFAEEVLAAAAAVREGQSRLELEITESALMEDYRRAIAILERLRDAGITVAIDDFGTGHSSLQTLSRLPADILKIDRSFVRDLDTNERHRTLVQTTITLANSFGMTTVAEGVETKEQLAILRELGCDAIQGYHVLRPADAGAIGGWLAARASAPR